jgi:hypothetical protein
MISKTTIFSKNRMSPVQKIAVSGMIMAMYIALMYFTQSFAFGQYQVRIATALYSLTGIFPFLVVPLGMSNALSNTLMGGMGPFDIFGGFAVGFITGGCIYLIKRLKLHDAFVAIPIIFGPGLIVPIWLSKIINVPYDILALNVCIGQILPGIAGVVIINQFKKRF